MIGHREMDRRAFMRATGRGAVALAALSLASRLGAQDPQDSQGAPPAAPSAASNVEMNSDAYKKVSLPPKPDASPSMDKDAIKEFESKLACPCPCTLDVYTCRTTDFQCGISPAVHNDVLAMVNGGHNADEILAALTGVYGDYILTAPRKEGFSLLVWVAPFAALAAGAVAIGTLLRSWRRNGAEGSRNRRPSSSGAGAATVGSAASGTGASEPTGVGSSAEGSAEEMARLEAALRDDSR
ncbi:MAG: cytochrome c-type biogenesis protein CcmH [Gemmatimonadota bacterium]